MVNDLTFITNEDENTLSERFNTLIKDTKFFDVLVGYFYTSGFHSIYKSLENTEKIRVLIGISTDRNTFDLIEESKDTSRLSHKEAKNDFSNEIAKEMEISEDSFRVEKGIGKFIEWLRSGKLEIKVYPSEKIHAKLYIMSFKEDDRDVGRVITGSSNFTKSGLKNNLEFNVELKNRNDYEFSLDKFNELWDDSIDVSEKYIETIRKETWLNDSITPYELYLKFLYEYLKEKINLDQSEMYKEFLPSDFMDLKYQKDAVMDAKMKLEEYGGVFISDVVGLGKTYISALLAQQLDGGSLIIAPPVLLDKKNPGSWPNVFYKFGINQYEYESRGKLDQIIQNGTEQYKNVFIDEAHDFRNESTQMYEKLFQICRGKRVILVTATPLNNTPMDILSQIKLFQNSHKSTLPNPKVRDLEIYFKSLERRLNGLDRQTDKEEYLRIVQENAEDIRENVLQYLMVRRTRTSVMKYYAKDLEKQELKFPEVNDPEPIIYEFDEEMDNIFNRTLELITDEFTYARYTPLLYLKKKIMLMEAPQTNMGKFMKILLLKRLESSFFAFKKSVGRFIFSYKKFIEEYKKGNVYISKDIQKIFELLENDDDEAIQKLIAEEKVTKYASEDFNSRLIEDLEYDLKLLEEIQDLWKDVISDPKVDEFIKRLFQDKNLSGKIVVFTESKETADYLTKKLNPLFDNKVMYFSGSSSDSLRSTIIQNFDAKSSNQADDYRILISTDVLSQGVNLHRSNVVINYDIPWNPTRMMQRVGRVQRVDTKFDEIFIYNFFPASKINENISLKEAAEAKIKAFIEMLGNDSKLLTDEEIKSHDLFVKLTSKSTITGEDEEEDTELKYLTFLRDIRDNNRNLFEKIKRLPKKSRTAKNHEIEHDSLLTFFRKGKLRKVFMNDGTAIEEIDFFKAAEILKSGEKTKKEKLGPNFYEYLNLNKNEFSSIFQFEEEPLVKTRGGGYENQLIKRLKAIARSKQFTDHDEEYIQDVLTLLKEGSLPKGTMKKILNNIKDEIEPLKILAKLKSGIAPEYFNKTFVTNAADTSGPKEVILSEYLLKGD
ncbi:MAG: helicase-related protein [Methanobacteriaceae archaeon]|nr:helicase-related protein [Methanobacteriaceae archaeon]